MGDQDKQEENVQIDEDRASLYEKYAKEGDSFNKATVVEEGLPADPTDKKDEGETPPVKKESAPPAPEKSEGKGEPEKEPEKKVALSALHEERSRRKMLSEQVKILEDEKKSLVESVRQYGQRLESLEKKKIQEDPIDDVEAVIKSQKEEIATLNKRLGDVESRWVSKEKTEEITQAKAKEQELLKQVEEVDLALSKEGFPGFKDLASEVAREVMVKVQEDESNKAVFANPDGWKKLYKEKVYPRIKTAIIANDKNSKKEELKIKANLIDNPGGAPKSKEPDEKEDDESSYESYMKMRQKNLA
jgi:hypothetical protein